MSIVSSPPSCFRTFSIQRIKASHSERTLDTVAVEEPLSIRLEHWFKGVRASDNLALTMRTPGHDRELTAGFLLSEGIIQNPVDLVSLHALGTEPSNEIVAELSPDVNVDAWRTARHVVLNSSCGVCGKSNLNAMLESMSLPVQDTLLDDLRVSAGIIQKMPSTLAEFQQGFAQTGGLHASALLTADGEPLAVFEDIGRHNALDKLVGQAFLSGMVPIRNHLLFLSSRSSFELVQKTAMAGAPLLATVGSPSSLAIETARRCGVTLIGFVRDGRFNVYSGEWRIKL